MALTKEQVSDLKRKVGSSTEIPLEFELDWLQGELKGAEAAEKKTILAFHYHEAMRNDEGMINNEKALSELRNSIKYFKTRIDKLQKKILAFPSKTDSEDLDK